MKTDEQEAIDNIKKYCEPYLKATKNIGLFYRGDSHPGAIYVPGMLYRKEVRTDRKTSAMNQRMANKLNTYLEKNGHCRRDKSIMATSDQAMTGFHGKLYYIFPMEQFEYTFAATRDINMEWLYSDYRSVGEGSETYLNIMNGKLKDIPKYFFITNKDIIIAFDRNHEIWFKCSNVFLLTEGSIEENKLKQLLWG